MLKENEARSEKEANLEQAAMVFTCPGGNSTRPLNFLFAVPSSAGPAIDSMVSFFKRIDTAMAPLPLGS